MFKVTMYEEIEVFPYEYEMKYYDIFKGTEEECKDLSDLLWEVICDDDYEEPEEVVSSGFMVKICKKFYE